MTLDISVFGTVGLFNVCLSVLNKFWSKSDVLIKNLAVNNSGVVQMVNSFVRTCKQRASNQPYSGKYAAVFFEAAKKCGKD
jgi:hypothetical protein